jgi:phosphate/sulfate permease
MYIYFLLLSGIFMGWSLGTNEAANVFWTAFHTKAPIHKADFQTGYIKPSITELL